MRGRPFNLKVYMFYESKYLKKTCPHFYLKGHILPMSDRPKLNVTERNRINNIMQRKNVY